MPYYEGHDDNATTNFSFDQTGGSAKGYYYVESADAQYLQGTITDLLGYTSPFPAASGTNGQALRRTIPKTHPKFPYLYASRVSSVEGMGTALASRQPPTAPPVVQPQGVAMGARPIADYEQYLKYKLGIEFTGPRPYSILADDQFSRQLNGSAVPPAGGSAVNFTYAPEWVRYTEFDYGSIDNTIQGQTGQLSLVINGTTLIPFTSPPWMWLPDQVLRITWYQVPLRYIMSPNSYIANRDWKGRINQNDWWLWPKGSLLYTGFNIKKYSPPTGDTQTITSTFGQTLYLNYAQLCDVELTFLYTRRSMSGSLGADIANGNYIPYGHNLLPNLNDMKYYYGVTTTSTASVQNRPPWLSFPCELLFSDPDVNTVTGL